MVVLSRHDPIDASAHAITYSSNAVVLSGPPSNIRTVKSPVKALEPSKPKLVETELPAAPAQSTAVAPSSASSFLFSADDGDALKAFSAGYASFAQQDSELTLKLLLQGCPDLEPLPGHIALATNVSEEKPMAIDSPLLADDFVWRFVKECHQSSPSLSRSVSEKCQGWESSLELEASRHACLHELG